MKTSEQIDLIATACAKVQATLENVLKDGNNPHFKSKYATLPEVLNVVRPAYSAEDVAIFQAPCNGENGAIGVTTRLAHKSGQWIESTLYCHPSKPDAQGIGSVITYLCRYSLCPMAAISGDDDDGNAAVGKPPISNVQHPPFLTKPEIDSLTSLISEVGADTRKFCEHFGVDSVAAIPASRLHEAEVALESHRAAKARRAAREAANLAANAQEREAAQ